MELSFWMNPVVSNLLSGLIGALIGAFITSYFYYRSRQDSARQKLLGLVYQLGFKSHWDPEPGRPALIFHEHYPRLWEAYADLRRSLPRWRRKSLDKAWQKYVKVEYYKDIPDDQISKVFFKGTVSTKEEAVRVSSEFVIFLSGMR